MNKERNPVGWFEIYVSDMDRARKFYEAVLDVEMEALPSPDPDVEMVAFPMDHEKSGACGALAKMEGCQPGGGTMVYFSCTDCAEDEARVEPAGGQVIKPKFSIGPYGFISIISDPDGNIFGLHNALEAEGDC